MKDPRFCLTCVWWKPSDQAEIVGYCHHPKVERITRPDGLLVPALKTGQTVTCSDHEASKPQPL